MSREDSLHTITKAKARVPSTLMLEWSDGTKVTLDIREFLKHKPFRALRNPDVFARARVGEWGHGVEWSSDIDLSADTLWLETLSATGRGDTREFLEWRLRHGLSLSAAADALGVSRRMVAYYSSGEKPVPRPILLACKGWEASHAA